MRCFRMFADNANRLNQLNMLYARACTWSLLAFTFCYDCLQKRNQNQICFLWWSFPSVLFCSKILWDTLVRNPCLWQQMCTCKPSGFPAFQPCKPHAFHKAMDLLCTWIHHKLPHNQLCYSWWFHQAHPQDGMLFHGDTILLQPDDIACAIFLALLVKVRRSKTAVTPKQNLDCWIIIQIFIKYQLQEVNHSSAGILCPSRSWIFIRSPVIPS